MDYFFNNIGFLKNQKKFLRKKYEEYKLKFKKLILINKQKQKKKILIN